jgi:FAD synthetase
VVTVDVVAQGTFDILHPGHVHYLREARAMGDRLHVVVARGENVTHKAPPVISNRQRVEMVEALDPVDHARLGHPEDIFVPIEEIEPDVIALGYDQHHEVEGIEAALEERGLDCDVRRAGPREPREDEILSSGSIIEKILDERDG